ncbi:hypothetical protein CB1_000527002 [Camelus ferus]|nr:hypothetical protein CB1_000527002 [Camelus ferus]
MALNRCLSRCNWRSGAEQQRATAVGEPCSASGLLSPGPGTPACPQVNCRLPPQTRTPLCLALVKTPAPRPEQAARARGRVVEWALLPTLVAPVDDGSFQAPSAFAHTPGGVLSASPQALAFQHRPQIIERSEDSPRAPSIFDSDGDQTQLPYRVSADGHEFPTKVLQNPNPIGGAQGLTRESCGATP